MAREQMICFVTPNAPTDIAPAVTRRIDALLRKVRRVHFATLALLPPAPDASALARPSLMFEVVTDEDLLLPDLVELMLQHAFAVLWQLYKVNWSGPRHADVGSKREWLRAFLLAHASPADCGFVGARDRNVAQVLAEDDLFEEARKALHRLPPAQRPADARALAERMVSWAMRHGFGWITVPAPRSRWRKGPDFGVADGLALAVHLVLPVIAFLGVLVLMGGIVFGTAHGLKALGLPSLDETPALVFMAALALLLALVVPSLLALSTGMGLLALVAFIVVFSLLAIGVAAGAGIYALLGDPAWPRLAANLGLLGLLGFVTFAFAAGFVVLMRVLFALRAPPFFLPAAVLSLMGGVYALTWMFARLMLTVLKAFPWIPPSSAGSMPQRLAWVLAAAVAVVAVLALGIGLFTRWVPALLAMAGGRLDKPAELPQLPAHQVHPSLQACEAALARRTSHMISLTELKRPYRWSRFKLCVAFRLIQALGDTVFTEGVLGNARGIKFGHWHIIGNGRRLLFCSNFDSALGGYLDEFILGASEGINLIWRNSKLRPRSAARWDQPGVELECPFPLTRALIYKGCKAEQDFKAYVRASMLPHLHRFEAYCLANEDIERATRLREALRGTRTALKDDQIARALES